MLPHLEEPARVLLVLSTVIGTGLALGNLRVVRLQLGVAGVLFTGLLMGHLGYGFSGPLNDLLREFGLVLFVYTIGIQVGPRFFDSLRRFGWRLNVLAAAVVVLGAALTLAISRLCHLPIAEAVGMFSGATTNTPSLAAAQQALQQLPGIDAEQLKLPGLSYAVAYPFGILGIIVAMALTRVLGRLDPAAEAAAYAEAHARHTPNVEARDFRLDNANLDGLALDEVSALRATGAVISRVLRGRREEVALPDTVLHLGDVVRAVGRPEELAACQQLLGTPVPVTRAAGGPIATRQVLVTRRRMVGRTIEALEAFLYGVTVTRISRGDVEFPASPEVEIRYADRLTVVGEEDAIRFFAREVGNSEDALQHPQLIPIFIGIALGVWLGVAPLRLPGMPAPVHLGMAGGPLVVALVLSRLGKLGPFVWAMPTAANLMLRELGIALFLACVGLRSGDRLMEALTNGHGVMWLAGGAVVTLVPLALLAWWARARGRMNYLTLCGLLAGSMTDPPALAFANQLARSNAQVVAYAAVYPLVMLLRILTAQLLVLCGGR